MNMSKEGPSYLLTPPWVKMKINTGLGRMSFMTQLLLLLAAVNLLYMHENTAFSDRCIYVIMRITFQDQRWLMMLKLDSLTWIDHARQKTPISFLSRK